MSARFGTLWGNGLIKNRVSRWAVFSAVLVGGAAIAYAALPIVDTPSGTVNVCFKPKNGRMRLVNEGTICKPNELPAQWELPRTVFVPADGTPAQNGTALLAAAAAMTGDANRPPTLQLDDGTYDLGATTLVLSGIVLQGRSTDHTIITATGSAAFSQTQGGTVRTDADLHTLTVNNTGNTYAAGIVFVGAVGRVTDVNVNVSGGTNAYGVTNALGDVIARGLRVSTGAPNESVGFLHDFGALGARSKVFDSRIIVSSPAVGQGEGIRAVTGSELRVSTSAIEGSSFYMNAQAGSSDIVFRNSALSGAPNGLVACRATSTASNFFTTTCPTEFWNTGSE